MKILYIKNNSERAKEFQLKTIIYEENGTKYVKKQAICIEAIPHLKKMKENYITLAESIINPKIKIAKIIAETQDSLTFEFIEGISLEHKLDEALQVSDIASHLVVEEYLTLLKTGFKTTKFNSNVMVSNEMKTLFQNIDFSLLDTQLCFDGISNIDLIFSNIIYKNDDIYLIDYEWTYSLHLPINYIAYRTIHMLSSVSNEFLDKHELNLFSYHKMERSFVDKYVMNNGFYGYKSNYLKTNSLITKQIEQLKEHVENKNIYIQELIATTESINDDLFYARSIVELRDQQLIDMTLKKRLKRVIKKFIPKSLLYKFGTNVDNTIKNSPLYKYSAPHISPSIKTSIDDFSIKPLISIIMPTYNVDPKWLNLAIESIKLQWYENWELCIADDKSTNEETIAYLKNIHHPQIKVIFLEQNLNISGASNAALQLASGEYISLMDNDDEITPDALYEMVKAINEKDAEFIYSDEDFITTDGECKNPHFKPDFSPDLLLSHNYITHFTCFKKTLLDKVGNFNSKFDGSQDYDLFLRLTEKTSKIYHIQKVLYHWRMLETSTSINSDVKPEALERGKLVLEEALKRRNIPASIVHTNIHHYFRVKYNILDNPLVSIIIPFKDKPELLDVCIHSILEKSTYKHFEIICISNNSTEYETFSMMEKLEKKDTRISFYEYNVEFNYANINNHAVNTYAKGKHILLLNNDIEVITPDWIESMLEHSQRDEVGCVGAKLYYPNDTIQHAGIIIGLGGYAGHSHKMHPRTDPGYFNRLSAVQNVSAVTAACLMIKKDIYTSINGMDEINFKVAYNDVDFCLRVREQGYLNIFTPFSELYHHESISRGYETTPEKIARFQTEKDALFNRHSHILTTGDPYYNPNLTLDKEDFTVCQQS